MQTRLTKLTRYSPSSSKGEVYSEKCQCEHMTETLNEQVTFAAQVTRERETKETQTHTK